MEVKRIEKRTKNGPWGQEEKEDLREDERKVVVQDRH